MVDNVQISAGSGTSIATDEVSGDHYQKVKLAVGATDTATLAVMTYATDTFDAVAASAYTADDHIADNATAGGGSVTELSYTIAAGAGTIRRVRLRKDTPATTVSHVRVWFFEGAVAAIAGDNEAFDLNAANCIGFCDVSVTVSANDFAVGWVNVDIPFVNGTLTVMLQDKVGHTPVASDSWHCDLWYIPG